MRKLVYVYSVFILIALLFGSSGCAVLFSLSSAYKTSTFHKRQLPYKMERIESAYLSPQGELVVCVQGWLPMPSYEDRYRKNYTIRIPIEAIKRCAPTNFAAVSTSVRRLTTNMIVLRGDTITEGWPTEQMKASQQLTPIQVVNPWEGELAGDTGQTQQFLRLEPPALPDEGIVAAVYDTGLTPYPLCRHDIELTYVQRDPFADGTHSVIVCYDPEWKNAHSAARRYVLYPLTAPLVVIVDIVALPVKAVMVVYVVTHAGDFWP